MYSMFSNLFVSNPVVALWVLVSLGGAIVAGLSMIYFDHAVIFGSAIGGSYSFVRVSAPLLILQGISEFGGGFPNEFLIAQQFQNDSIGQVQPSFFGYFIVMTVAATLSIVFQLK